MRRAYVAAVNVDAEEGDLNRMNPGEVERFVPFSRWDLISTNSEITSRMARYSRGTPLWNYFLYLALACFVVELLLANTTGKKV